MKTLLLLRHAKAGWGKSQLDDFDRELTPDGIVAASRIGTWLAENRQIPDVALVSTARRAQQTWQQVTARSNNETPLLSERSLYLATPGDILALLAKVETTVQRVIIVAHNPGIESLGQLLAGPDSEPDAAISQLRGYPTAGLAIFSIDAESWAEVESAPVRLVAFIRPREL